ncbi:MAG TPA: hypothetical protein VFB25_10855 [Gaiellaceae bacterium]|nr:hypothetical protein [Gaiellaceae bacterium]
MPTTERTPNPDRIIRFRAGASHGSPYTYARGCRCQYCRVAWREYRRIKEAARRARIRAEREAAASE